VHSKVWPGRISRPHHQPTYLEVFDDPQTSRSNAVHVLRPPNRDVGLHTLCDLEALILQKS
jgi:hypothetical protein